MLLKLFSITATLLIYGFLVSLPQCSGLKSWEDFQEKHITSDPVQGFNCTKAMNNPIFIVNGQCKAFNTFIHATSSAVKVICQGVTGTKDKTSTAAYPQTECRKQDRCNYSERSVTSVICVTCSSGRPVHFVRRGKC